MHWPPQPDGSREATCPTPWFHRVASTGVSSHSAVLQCSPAPTVHRPEHHYPEGFLIPPHLTQIPSAQSRAVYVGTPYTSRFDDTLESRRPAPPPPYLAWQQTQVVQRDTSKLNRFPPSEGTPHGLPTQESQSKRSSRATSTAESSHGQTTLHRPHNRGAVPPSPPSHPSRMLSLSPAPTGPVIPAPIYGAVAISNATNDKMPTMENSVVIAPPSTPTSSARRFRKPAKRRQYYSPCGKPTSKRTNPPEPFTSYAIMLADIIRDSRREKMTLLDLYHELRRRYPDYFPSYKFDDKSSGKGRFSRGWMNTVRHALCVNKWFKKQVRTALDAMLDETQPDRYESPPIDNDAEKVAQPTNRSHIMHCIPSSSRPLKGGYWFIRKRYNAEVDVAIAKNKERVGSGHESEVHFVGRPPRLENRRHEAALTIVRPAQPSGQLRPLPGLPPPPEIGLDPLNLHQPRPTFLPLPPSRTWPYPLT